MNKVYLGDSVYAKYDGFHFILTTENGGAPTNEIFLEPNVLGALSDYVGTIINKGKEDASTRSLPENLE